MSRIIFNIFLLDKNNTHGIIHIMETKIEKFKKVVRANRLWLVKKGFNEATVNSWAYRDRVPSLENAKLLSDYLDMPLSEIPYYRNERVI